jgi:hypothetical protein
MAEGEQAWRPSILHNGRALADGICADAVGAGHPDAGGRFPDAGDRFPRPQGEPSSRAQWAAAMLRSDQAAFLSRCIVLQAVGAAIIAALWISGLAGRPFEGAMAPLSWLIVAVGALGIACVFLRRWRDVQWIATHVVRIGLLGTVVGLIIAFAAARHGAADVEAVRTMIAAVVDGMYVSLFATLLGIATNLWLKINLLLLGNVHG